MHLIDGKSIALEIQAEVRRNVSLLEGRKPGLAFILVGDDSASQAYVRAKKKACSVTGITSTLIELPRETSETALLHHILSLNTDPNIDGILVQLPLPLHINDRTVMRSIDPKKDVDGFHPINMGKLLLGEEDGFLPCTPHGIKILLNAYKIPIQGKRVVIVGRSNIVGKPLAAILMQKKPDCNATVTVAHSQSEHLAEITKSADILIAAIGQPHFIRKEMVRKGAVVIDVGINRLSDGRLVGDVACNEIAEHASWISPVPGGVGPMTIAMLLQNTLSAYVKNSLL